MNPIDLARNRLACAPGSLISDCTAGMSAALAAIAEAHGAWLQAHALPGGGLGVRAGFPLAPSAPFTGPGIVAALRG
ncbi:MAG TPA: hypothetical protein VFJ07_10530 [Streptosporangiaceae bacterium]|nr:hypothetical protein [Streptosporangiaceae bacterium]